MCFIPASRFPQFALRGSPSDPTGSVYKKGDITSINIDINIDDTRKTRRPLSFGERVTRDGAFTSRRGPGEG
jgi:hypothetical protein